MKKKKSQRVAVKLRMQPIDAADLAGIRGGAGESSSVPNTQVPGLD